MDLATVQSVARSRRARVIDVVLAVLAEAITRTHPAFAARAHHRLRASVPIMARQRSPSGSGNVTAAVMIDLPLSAMDLDTRLAHIGRHSTRLLTAPRVLASRFVMTTVLGALPATLQRACARAAYGPAFLQAIVSNMPGPTVPMTLTDVPLEFVVPILPLAPGAPLAMGALSCNGVLGLGLATDPQYLDADTLLAAMQQGLRELAHASLPNIRTINHVPHQQSTTTAGTAGDQAR